MNYEKIVFELQQGAQRLASDDEIGEFERLEVAGVCALAALVVGRWKENDLMKTAPAVEVPVEVKPSKKKASGGKGGRPRGVPCPAVDSGRHAYGPDGRCKNCPAQKGGAVPVPVPVPVPDGGGFETMADFRAATEGGAE